MSNQKVEILLATYNGERYLSSQLASLLAQDWDDFSITVSDDGSTDATWTILEQFAAKSQKIRLLRNAARNGIIGNFTFLMEQSTAEYVAFCDQDDLWDSNKLSILMEQMKKLEAAHEKAIPILLYSDMRLIDVEDRILTTSLWKQAGVIPPKARFRNLLAQNLVTGCTTLANRVLLEKAKPICGFSPIMMHDYWLSLVAMAFGVCYPVETQTISYRQHASNAVGAGAKLTILQRVKRILLDPELSRWIVAAAKQADYFATRYSEELSDDLIKALHVVKELPKQNALRRVWSMTCAGISRTGTLNQLQFLLRVAIGSREL